MKRKDASLSSLYMSSAEENYRIAQELADSLRQKAGLNSGVTSWLSDDPPTVHLSDGRKFPLKNQTSRKFYRMMFDKVGSGDIDEVEAEIGLGLPDHRKARKTGEREVRLRDLRIDGWGELIARSGRLKIRLKYPPR